MKVKGIPMTKVQKVLLFVPVLLSVSWIVFLQGGDAIAGEQFAPASTGALLLALVIFTVGYLLFLLLLFSDDIKDLFSKSR